MRHLFSTPRYVHKGRTVLLQASLIPYARAVLIRIASDKRATIAVGASLRLYYLLVHQDSGVQATTTVYIIHSPK